jgi:hypothetical protein
MKYWNIIMGSRSILGPEVVGRKVPGETAQDALELWRLQHPQFWNSIDLKNRTINGETLRIVESHPNEPEHPIILL